MAGSVSVRVITDTRLAGLDTLSRRFSQDARRVLVGVPAGKTETDGTSTAMVAAVNEFGSADGRIPERSFLRGGILGSLPDLISLNAANIQKIARGGFTVLTALNRLGSFAAGKVKAYIVAHDFVPNAPSTIARKKSDRPLVDTGSLRQSITYEIGAQP
jgi:hypothetical protein